MNALIYLCRAALCWVRVRVSECKVGESKYEFCAVISKKPALMIPANEVDAPILEPG